MGLEIVDVLLDVVANYLRFSVLFFKSTWGVGSGGGCILTSSKVTPLKISVQVHLDDAVADGLTELLLGRTATSVEDEEDGLLLVAADLVGDKDLVLAEELRVQANVARAVHAVDVSKAGGARPVGRDGLESLVDGVDVLGLGVQGVVVNTFVVDTILLTAGDADLHLEPLLHGGSTLEVAGGGLNVLVDRLLGQVDHVRREQRSTVLLEELLILIQHAIEPREELLGAMISVKNNRDAIGGSHSTNVMGRGDGADHGSLLLLGAVLETLSGEVGGTTLGSLKDNGRLLIAGSLEDGDGSRAGGHVGGGDREALLLGVGEELENVIA